MHHSPAENASTRTLVDIVKENVNLLTNKCNLALGYFPTMPNQKEKGETSDPHTEYFCITKLILNKRIDKKTRQERYSVLYQSQKHWDLELINRQTSKIRVDGTPHGFRKSCFMLM